MNNSRISRILKSLLTPALVSVCSAANATFHDLGTLPSGSFPAYYHFKHRSGQGFSAVGLDNQTNPGYRTFPTVFDLGSRAGHLTEDISDALRIIEQSEQAALAGPRYEEINRTSFRPSVGGGFHVRWEGWVWSSDFKYLNYSRNWYWNYLNYSNRACPDGFQGDLYVNTDNTAEDYYCLPDADRFEPLRNTGQQCSLRANPINTSTGNKFEIVPVTADPTGGGLDLNLYYNSLAEDGDQWRHTFDRSISASLKHSFENVEWLRDYPTARHVFVTVRRPDGVSERFRNLLDFDTLTTEDTSWAGPANAGYALETVNDSNGAMTGYLLSDTGGVREHYDLGGQLTKIDFPDGHSVVVSYDADEKIDQVIDEWGRSLTFGYDAAGLMNQVTAPSGAVYGFEYLNGLLTALVFPDETPADDADNPRRIYHYEQTAFPSHLTGITDERGIRVATWTYDDQGRAISSEHAGGADRYTLAYHADGTTTVTDPLAHERAYRFVNQHGLVKLDTVVGGTCSQCGGEVRLAAHYNYDANGFLASKTDDKGHVSTYVRDALGQPLSRTEAVGTPEERTVTTTWHPTLHKPDTITEPYRTTVHTYTARGQLETRTATDTQSVPNVSRTTTYHYDAEGRLEWIDGPRTDVSDLTTFTYHAGTNNRATVSNALGHLTQYTDYDAAGQLTRMVDPNGLVTSFSYTPRGWLKTRTVGEGTEAVTTSFSYDAAGHLDVVTLPEGGYLDYDYDDAGRLTDITDSLGNTLHYTLDAMGNRRLEESKDPAGAIKRTLERVYDDLNRLDALRYPVDGTTQETDYGYDANGNLTGVNDALSRSTTSDYDALDRLIEQIDPKTGQIDYEYDTQDNLTRVTDPNDNPTVYEYNGFDEKTRQVSPDTGETTYVYDEAGNLTSRTDARGITATYTYDALNRPTAVEYPDSSLNVSFAYDQGSNGLGQLTRMTDAAGVTDYTYGPRGNLVLQTRTTDALTTSMGYAYDGEDRLVELTYPSGRKVHYDYDATGVTTATLEQVDGSQQVLAENIVRLPFGPMKALTYGNGLTLTRSFDLGYRLIDQQVPGILQADYDYDAVGNLVQWLDTLDAARDQGFGYDELDRLLSASGPFGQYDYSYDANGNRLTFDDGGTTESYTYAIDSNRLLEITGGLTDSRSYDAAGNTTASAAGQFIYDDTHRLVQYDDTGVSATYAYNGRGERMSKTVNGVLTRFRHGPGGQLVGEYDAAGEPIREYVYLDGEPLAFVTASETAAQFEIAGELDGAPVPTLIRLTPASQGVALNEPKRPSETLDLSSQFWEDIDHGDGTRTIRFDWQESTESGTAQRLGEIYLADGQVSGHLYTLRPPARDDSYFGFSNPDGSVTASDGTLSWLIDTSVHTVQILSGDPASGTYSIAPGSWSEMPWGGATQYVFANTSAAGVHISGSLTRFPDGYAFGDLSVRVGETQSAFYPLISVQTQSGSSEAIYYAHTDHLGTVVRATDQNQQVVWDADRRPFGELDILTEQVTMPLRFPGQYFDAESGLYYNYFRDYDPTTGRYIQSDPIGLQGGLNTYLYANANPVRFDDPLGLNPGAAGAALRAALAAARAAKKAIEKAYNVCKNIRCKIEIHGPHHRFGWPFNKRMCHVQLTCWVKGRKGSTFIQRFPYPCDGPGAPGTPSNPSAPRGSNNPSGANPNDPNTQFGPDIPGVPSWGVP